jgi:hypothetical protein
MFTNLVNFTRGGTWAISTAIATEDDVVSAQSHELMTTQWMICSNTLSIEATAARTRTP